MQYISFREIYNFQGYKNTRYVGIWNIREVNNTSSCIICDLTYLLLKKQNLNKNADPFVSIYSTSA